MCVKYISTEQNNKYLVITTRRLYYYILFILTNSSNAQMCQLRSAVPFLKIFEDLIRQRT